MHVTANFSPSISLARINLPLSLSLSLSLDCVILYTYLIVPIDNTIIGSEFYEYELDCELMFDDCTYVYYLLRGPQMYALLLLKKPG